MSETTNEMLDTEDDDAVRAFLRSEGVTEDDIESIIAAGPVSRALLNVDRYQPVEVLRESTRRFKREFPETYGPERACEVPTCVGTPATRFSVFITQGVYRSRIVKYGCRRHTDLIRGAMRDTTTVMPRLLGDFMPDARWTWDEEVVS